MINSYLLINLPSMNPAWSNRKWSIDTPLNSRNLVSLFFALIVLWIILLIPIKKPIVFNEDDVMLIELIKSPVNDQIKQPLPNKIIENKPNIETPKPIKKIEPKPDTIKKEAITESIKKPSIEPTVTIKKTVIDAPKTELPNAGMILNSLDEIKSFAPLDDDFQAKKDTANDFKSKNMVPQQLPHLSPYDEQLSNDLAVKDHISTHLRVIKSVAGFLSFIPIDDKEKSVDDMKYCSTLGRKSTFCPTSNPLEY